MAQSLAQNYQHIVFSTKQREPWLQAPAARAEMHAYLGGICENLDSPALKIGGVSDHVHILCRMSKSITVEQFLQELKKQSSKWIKGRFDNCRGFYWQSGYGAFSISSTHVSRLVAYIAGQESHHRSESFQDELRRLLRMNGMGWDERYVWN